jgi:hypothetical protein
VVAGSNENVTTTSLPSAANATTATSVISGKTTTSLPNATLVKFISNIEQINGHLDQALTNKQSGNNTLAQTHVLHTIEEVYPSIEDQLTNQNSTLNQTLSAALLKLSSSVTNATLTNVASQIDHINMLLKSSAQATVPSSELNNNSAFNASVVARLLNVAGHQYQQAVGNGTVKAILEYQDAQAFIRRAQSIFNSSASRINQSTMAPEIEQVNKFFSNLNGSVMNKDDPATVKTTIDGITHGLSEVMGLSENQLVGEGINAAVEEEEGTIPIINHIKSLLNQNLLDAYRSQDYATAENIAIEAYLDNYENIEIAIAEHDRALMEQTELMLREDLRQMIKDRVSIEQIEQQVTMIDANLDRATELLQ